MQKLPTCQLTPASFSNSRSSIFSRFLPLRQMHPVSIQLWLEDRAPTSPVQPYIARSLAVCPVAVAQGSCTLSPTPGFVPMEVSGLTGLEEIVCVLATIDLHHE